MGGGTAIIKKVFTLPALEGFGKWCCFEMCVSNS